MIRSRRENSSTETFHDLQLCCMILVLRERQSLCVCACVFVCSCKCFLHSCSTFTLACRPDRMIIMHHTTIMCFVKTHLSLSFHPSVFSVSSISCLLSLSHLWVCAYVLDGRIFLLSICISVCHFLL